MPPRFHVPPPLPAGAAAFDLPEGAARHVQVLRLQPGAEIVLFDGTGGEWTACIERMGRRDVAVSLREHRAVNRELGVAVTLALGMPANERMDALVEKATELGVATIQPLVCERSVLRLAGERAAKKVTHWQGVAVAACEQSGRTAVPVVAPVRAVGEWLAALPDEAGQTRLVLSLREARPLHEHSIAPAVIALSGPEGGLSAVEEDAAYGRGFAPVTLGPRVLRADTAPLALLAGLALRLP